MSDNEQDEVLGTISTRRHEVVRYRIGHDSGDVFEKGGDYDGPTLVIEVSGVSDAKAMLAAIGAAAVADCDLVERAQAALRGVTAGPWRVLEGKHGLQVHSERFWIANIKCEACPGQEAQNAAFIPAARELVPAMAARIEALEFELHLAQIAAKAEAERGDALARELAAARQIERNVQAAREAEHQRAEDALRKLAEVNADAERLVEALEVTRDNLSSVLHSEFDGVWDQSDFQAETKEADAALAAHRARTEGKTND